MLLLADEEPSLCFGDVVQPIELQSASSIRSPATTVSVLPSAVFYVQTASRNLALVPLFITEPPVLLRVPGTALWTLFLYAILKITAFVLLLLLNLLFPASRIKYYLDLD